MPRVRLRLDDHESLHIEWKFAEEDWDGPWRSWGQVVDESQLEELMQSFNEIADSHGMTFRAVRVVSSREVLDL